MCGVEYYRSTAFHLVFYEVLEGSVLGVARV